MRVNNNWSVIRMARISIIHLEGPESISPCLIRYRSVQPFLYKLPRDVTIIPPSKRITHKAEIS
jgi:hypothetical protein